MLLIHKQLNDLGFELTIVSDVFDSCKFLLSDFAPDALC